MTKTTLDAKHISRSWTT